MTYDCEKCGGDLTGMGGASCSAYCSECGTGIFKLGDKVTYVPTNEHSIEHGIVKSAHKDGYVFVVYHCNQNWKNYYKYTAASTKITDLLEGWL